MEHNKNRETDIDIRIYTEVENLVSKKKVWVNRKMKEEIKKQTNVVQCNGYTWIEVRLRDLNKIFFVTHRNMKEKIN